ncbi:hypothetical protein [Fictibacillus terranigra]|uniref:Uncharacterized protein n=1 Tax=Fictibacillus terranigra TaxID=3058424 RepID=A0ABT8EDN4_9BACL|nr:hypothetical protein [Fictibacillus sp. CENA-BCM004]MDN4075972.1 hypothetical protein [Fictibacillus sp. CENA-BCM004]
MMKHEIAASRGTKNNLLLQQATLPKVAGTPFHWKDSKLGQGLTNEYLLHGGF